MPSEPVISSVRVGVSDPLSAALIASSAAVAAAALQTQPFSGGKVKVPQKFRFDDFDGDEALPKAAPAAVAPRGTAHVVGARGGPVPSGAAAGIASANAVPTPGFPTPMYLMTDSGSSIAPGATPLLSADFDLWMDGGLDSTLS